MNRFLLNVTTYVVVVSFLCLSSADGSQNQISVLDSVKSVFQCVFHKDHRQECFFERASRALEIQRIETLAEADQEYERKIGSSGARAKDEDKPSAISTTVTNIISELTDILTDSVSSFFSDLKLTGDGDVKDTNKTEDEEEADEEEDEADDDDEEDDKVEEESEDKPTDGNGRGVIEGRKKKKVKKIHKLIALIKLLIIGAVLKAKLTVLLQLLSAHLQIKFFFIALVGLLINVARFWIDLKKSHNPQKVIYYEHAQHQHHYDTSDEEYGGGGSSGFWGRSSQVPENENADKATEERHRIVYNGHYKPEWAGY